jgi:hypothetical protein
MLKILTGQALHAKITGFIHLGTKQWLFFDSDLASDMQEAPSDLRGKCGGLTERT